MAAYDTPAVLMNFEYRQFQFVELLGLALMGRVIRAELLAVSC